MNLNLTPVKVDISIESLTLNRDAFYRVCFIADNDVAPRTIEVFNLKELLDFGYTRNSLAYNFCVGIFSQEGIPSVIIRAKRGSETYEDAFAADYNYDYYYVVIQSKDITIITNFNDYLVSSDEYKLQFYSSNSPSISDKKLVHYYQNLISPVSVSPLGKINIVNHYINEAYNLGYIVDDLANASTEELQRARLAYPEASWISQCGNSFPSKVQWLHKYLAKVDIVKDKTIPNLANTTSVVMKNKATVGSGTTTQGIVIHEQVSLDWVKWALGRKVWGTLYSKGKVNATNGGLDLIINDVKLVLDVAVEQEIFSSYTIADASISSKESKISIRFNAMLTQSIVNVEINGSLYY